MNKLFFGLFLFFLLFPSVLGINELYPIQSNNKDYYYDSATKVEGTNLLLTAKVHTFEPEITRISYFEINITNLPKNNISINITSVIFHYYIDSFVTTGKPAPPKTYSFEIYNVSTFIAMGTGGDTHTTNGWKYKTLKQSDINILMNTNQTTIRAVMSSAPLGTSKTLNIRAREHTSGSYTAYLNVTYNIITEESPTTTERTIIEPPPKKKKDFNPVFLSLFALMGIIMIIAPKE